MKTILLIEIAHIGRSNREHSEVAARIIQHLADSLTNDIHRLDEAVATVSPSPSGTSLCLHHKRDTLVKQLDRCKVALAPHKRLSVDVIQYIFLLCSEDDKYGGNVELPRLSKKLDRKPIQMILSHVCSLWRDIALATPSLWSKLRVSNFLTHIAAVTEVLSRLRRAPLSLSIEQDLPSYSDGLLNTAFFDTLQEIITRYQVRELSLQLFIEYHATESLIFIMDKVQKMLHTSLPDLEILNFSMNDPLGYAVEVDGLAQFLKTSNDVNSTTSGLPSLKVLHLDGFPWFYKCVHDHLCWGQLRVLSTTDVSINWALAILYHSRLLECFSVEDLVAYDAEPFEPVLPMTDLHIRLPHLRHLKVSFIQGSTNQDIHSFFGPLELPSLSSLCYAIAHFTRQDVWPYTPDPLIDERIRLDKLEELELYPSSPTWLLATWKKARNLRRLHLHSISALKFADVSSLTSGDVFPFLQDVNMDGTQDPGIVLQMIEERQKNAAAAAIAKGGAYGPILPFKSVKFICTEVQFKLHKDLAHALSKAGVQLKIHSDTGLSFYC
ncbi:hypothetical protein AMATHDRAFT_69472 [Amanita thiersii Skay4041]|uniref:Uncharacterized protein n=1 Tax=Amanita thiersii Skay4041 TaxID=703135 RepID=A0A2A9N8F0_9AGAR|nr:hypothetical protein AMATHDRAFT_69472 [Amanita thiersii Skay4041]